MNHLNEEAGQNDRHPSHPKTGTDKEAGRKAPETTKSLVKRFAQFVIVRRGPINNLVGKVFHQQIFDCRVVKVEMHGKKVIDSLPQQ